MDLTIWAFVAHITRQEHTVYLTTMVLHITLFWNVAPLYDSLSPTVQWPG